MSRLLLAGIAVVTIALGIAGVTTFRSGDQQVVNTIGDITEQAKEYIKNPLEQSVSEGAVGTASSVATTVPEEGIPLKQLNLQSAQQKALETAGVDIKTFVISKEMLICAETTLGASRLAAFMAGESPALIEMGKLVPCLNAP